jgi:hypothetical protein
MLKFLKILKLVSKYSDLVETLVDELAKALENEPNPGKITKDEICQILMGLVPAVIKILGEDKVKD